MDSTSSFPPLDELVSFFGMEPKLGFEGADWFGDGGAFTAVQDTVTIRASFQPAEGLSEIVILASGMELVRVQVRAFGHVRVLHDNGRQTLAISFGSEAESTAWLRLQPTAHLTVEGRDGFAP